MIRQDRQRSNMTASRGWIRGRKKLSPAYPQTRQKFSLAVLLNREWTILGETKRDEELEIPLKHHPSPLSCFWPSSLLPPFSFSTFHKVDGARGLWDKSVQPSAHCLPYGERWWFCSKFRKLPTFPAPSGLWRVCGWKGWKGRGEGR